jgi:1-acyl-sn-glycerol-3-phosphate acyltransferase
MPTSSLPCSFDAAGLGAAWGALLAWSRVPNSKAATVAVRGGLVAAVTTTVFNIAGRLGLLPRPVARAWWIATAFPGLGLMCLSCEFFNALGRVLGWSEDKRCGMCNWGFSQGLVLWAKLNGQVQINLDAASKKLYESIPHDRASVILINHSTFLDPLTLPVVTPHKYCSRVRILFMAKMLSWPLFGRCLKLCGHFPVFFSKYAEGNFKVDERQAAVTHEMEGFLHRGGAMMLFPEATLNKDPEGDLLPFRTGTFRMLSKQRVDVYLLAFDGTHRSWPRDAALGGLPATIGASLTKFETRYDAGESPEVMAARARADLHAQLRQLIDARLGRQ